MTKRIGVRELRQAASEHLKTVAGGEEIVVTDRGRPVARLVAASPAERRVDELVGSLGLIAPSRPRRRFADAVRLDGAPLSDLVAADRDERTAFSA